MCTLALAFQLDRLFPVIAGANRDEQLGRPAEGWALRDGSAGVRHAAPRDLLAGGTWMGVSDRGVFAALTNYHAPLDWYPDRDRRSRGEVVPLALSADSAQAARALLAGAAPEGWNPFHLVVADARAAFLWWYDGERSEMADLAPGLHVVTERSPIGACPRGALVRARWPIDGSPERIRELLATHAGAVPPEAATCIHRDPLYGTRSSAVLRLAAQLGASDLLVSEGSPCTSPLEDHSALLGALARHA